MAQIPNTLLVYFDQEQARIWIFHFPPSIFQLAAVFGYCLVSSLSVVCVWFSFVLCMSRLCLWQSLTKEFALHLLNSVGNMVSERNERYFLSKIFNRAFKWRNIYWAQWSRLALKTAIRCCYQCIFTHCFPQLWLVFVLCKVASNLMAAFSKGVPQHTSPRPILGQKHKAMHFAAIVKADYMGNRRQSKVTYIAFLKAI